MFLVAKIKKSGTAAYVNNWSRNAFVDCLLWRCFLDELSRSVSAYFLEQKEEDKVFDYLHSDCVGYLDQKKLLRGYLFIRWGRDILWKATLQRTTSVSRTAVAYMSTMKTFKEVICLEDSGIYFFLFSLFFWVLQSSVLSILLLILFLKPKNFRIHFFTLEEESFHGHDCTTMMMMLLMMMWWW